MGVRRVAIAWLVGLAACGGKPAAKAKHDAGSGAVPADAVVVTIERKPLGMADLEGYRWRARGGHAAFREARVAEGNEDWPAVAVACEKAMAADPTNAEAAWLLAVAYAKTGKLEQVLAPLHVAVAADFGKWADPSLVQPAFTAWRATPVGEAWQELVEAERPGYIAAINRGVVVMAHGDLFAVDAGSGSAGVGGGGPGEAEPVRGPIDLRWHRLTRTNGAVIGGMALPATKGIAYVTRRLTKLGTKLTRSVGLGAVNLANGHATRPTDLGTNGPLVVAGASDPMTLWIGQGKTARTLYDGKLTATKAPRPPGSALVVGKTVLLDRGKVPEVSADYDDAGLTSAIMLAKTSRVISAPSPGLIDGSTIVWSPDRTHVAFVAQLVETCVKDSPTTAAFVADATTGTRVELLRALGGIAIDWVDDDTIAVAGDGAVSLVDLGGTSQELAGAAGLIVPRRAPPCAPAPVEEPLPVEDQLGLGPSD